MLWALRLLYRLRALLGLPQWKYQVPQHHEDPLKMTFGEKLYMGYKYYYKAMILAEENSGLEQYFKNQNLQPNMHPDFVPETTITLSAGGDLIPYDSITPGNCQNLWNDAGDFFFNSDIVFANLETVAHPGKPLSAAPEIMLHDMFFNVDDDMFRIFSGNGQYKGYDIVSIANNHTLDLGEEGLLATMDFLEARKVAWCGAARTVETRDNITILEKGGIHIAFLAYTFSLNKHTLPPHKPWLCNHLYLNEADTDISFIIHQAEVARRQGADLIVAALHMGCAYQAYPSTHTVHNMHRICEAAGVDVLLGGHPHNPQPMEMYTTTNVQTGKTRQHFICYSQGDFVAYDIFKWCHLPLLLKLHITQGELHGKKATLITKVEARYFYMYQNARKELRLLDFEQVYSHAEIHVAETTIRKEIAELKHFWDLIHQPAGQAATLQ